MAILNPDQLQDTQQQNSGGLLGNLDPQTRQLIAFSMLGNMFGGGQRGGSFSSILPMIIQMKNQQRQQQLEQMRLQQFQMQKENFDRSMENFNLQKQKYARELEEYNSKKDAQQKIADLLNPKDTDQVFNQDATKENIPSPGIPETTIADDSGAENDYQPLDTGSMVASTDAGSAGLASAAANAFSNASQNQAQGQQVQAQSQPQKLAPISDMYKPDPNQIAQDEAKSRQIAALRAQAGDVKGAMESLQKPVTEIDKKVAQTDAALLEKVRNEASAADSILNLIPKYKEILDNTNDAVVGPLISKFGINKIISENVQKLNQIGNQITAISKPLQNTSNQNFSNADLQFLVESNVSTSQDKNPQYNALNNIEENAKRLRARSQFFENYLSSKGTLKGAEQEFNDMSNKYEAMANEALKKGVNNRGEPVNPAKVKAELIRLRGF